VLNYYVADDAYLYVSFGMMVVSCFINLSMKAQVKFRRSFKHEQKNCNPSMQTKNACLSLT
jgi:hypothetical protein